MRSRYHNALMIAGGLPHVYTKAVYQPEGKRDSAVKLTQSNGVLTLSYGNTERYAFLKSGETYLLQEAVIGRFTMTAVTREGDGNDIAYYECAEGVSTAICTMFIPLSDFNIALFPRSVDEIRHLNLMCAALGSGRDCLGGWEYPVSPGTRYSGIGKGTVPVYASPFGKSSWRAAKGKAAVGLEGELWQLGVFKNADGQAYACIRYDVSARTQRIGYTRHGAGHTGRYALAG